MPHRTANRHGKPASMKLISMPTLKSGDVWKVNRDLPVQLAGANRTPAILYFGALRATGSRVK
jgi:hypothetical protein